MTASTLRSTLLILGLSVVSTAAAGDEEKTPPSRLKVGLVQMALTDSVAGNRDRIVARIAEAASLGARVVVFPEGAVCGEGGHDAAVVDESLTAIRRAARSSEVYVLVGGKTWSDAVKKDANWMYVIGPDGRDLLKYEKLYDVHRARMPGVFLIDGIPSNAMICADRWLRGVEEVPIQQGAQISFELSNNYACEWVPSFEWYWNVPRAALRNNVWVLLTNSGNDASVVPSRGHECHGHSAVIAPDGSVVAASKDSAETIVVAELDLSQANRATALARGTHPALRPFWEAGSKLQQGQTVVAPPLTTLATARAQITLAVAQVTDDLPRMLLMINEARAKNADIVVFPERAIDESALESLRAAARTNRLMVVVGMEHAIAGQRRNSAFVIGADGVLLTRYDQLSATNPFDPGIDPAPMWFQVKGVPAIVTVGEDKLWTELAELAAVAGARVHIHLDHDAADGAEADLRRLQVWANMTSFHMFSATANVVGSTIWEDLRDAEERRAIVKGLPQPETGPTEIYSPFSANVVVRARNGSPLIVATRQVTSANPHHPARTSHFNPQMDAWYRLGAALIAPAPKQ